MNLVKSKIGTVISKREFNKIFLSKHNYVYKVLNEEMTHHNLTYYPGFNKDIIPFNLNGIGGMHFSLFNNITKYFCHGTRVAYIKLLDDSQIYVGKDFQFKTDKFFIEKIIAKEDFIHENINYMEVD